MSGSFDSAQVLRYDDPTSLETWKSLVDSPTADPHVQPGYVSLFASGDDRVMALRIALDASDWLVPMIERRFTSKVDDRNLADLTSAYGFGGPFLVRGSATPEDLAHVFELTRDWVMASGYVSAFLRLSGHINGTDPAAWPDFLHLTSRIVVVDTTLSPPTRWMRYEHKVRKNVKKAERAGCTVVSGSDEFFWSRFRDIYSETMRRRSASDRYFFSDTFFEGIATSLAERHRIFLTLDTTGHAVSAELVLHGSRTAYSFLGGTRSSAYPVSPNDLLKHAIVDWAHHHGVEQFVLGGGYAPDDGIFRYKKSFEPDGVQDFFTGRIVGDSKTYCELSAGSTSAQEFFPAYRA